MVYSRSTSSKIAIMTDSCCDLPKSLAAEYDIEVVPLRVVYGDTEYRDGVEISSDEVLMRMPAQTPTTSLPFPGDVLRSLDDLKRRGFSHVLAIHMASSLSGTLNLVKHLGTQVKDLVVDVVDSKSLSMCLGFTVLEAARCVREKASLNTAKSKAIDTLKRVKMYFIVESLEYMRRGGRIGRVSAIVGNLLDIKPIISFDPDGVAYVFAKVRGRRRSIERLVDIAVEKTRTAQCSIAVMHAGALLDAEALTERLRFLPNIKEVLTHQIGPVLGVHSGPGLVGICVLTHV